MNQLKKLTGSLISSRGQNTRVKYLFGFLILGTLFAKVLQTFTDQKKMSSPVETGYQVFKLLRRSFSERQSRYITAQAAHETANFTSTVFRNANNLFGFKYTGHKTEVGSYGAYGKYKTIEDSVKRYVSYYTVKGYPAEFPSPEIFIRTLKDNKYFEAPEAEYIKAVRYFLKLYFPESEKHISGAGASW